MQENGTADNDSHFKAVIFGVSFVAPAIVIERFGIEVSLILFILLIFVMFTPFVREEIRKIKWLQWYIFLVYSFFYIATFMNLLGYISTTLRTFIVVFICSSQMFIFYKISKKL